MIKKTIFFTIFMGITVVFTGCLCVPQYYTPSVRLERNISSNKYDISFSLSYLSDGDESIGRASEARLKEIIENKLIDSGFFSSVTYRIPSEKTRYHVHFIAHYSMCPANESVAHGLFVFSTYYLIPSWQNMYLDLSAILMYDNKKIYSISTSENLRCYIWLPLTPICLIWNNWLAWTVQEKNCVNYLLN